MNTPTDAMVRFNTIDSAQGWLASAIIMLRQGKRLRAVEHVARALLWIGAPK